MPKCSSKDSRKFDEALVESSGNLFQDLSFSNEEAASLQARTTLMLQIVSIIEDHGWTQEQAAKILRAVSLANLVVDTNQATPLWVDASNCRDVLNDCGIFN